MHCTFATKTKPKPVREEVYPSRLLFQNTDFSFIDRIEDPNRERRFGPKGSPPSAIFMALLLLHLNSIGSIPELIRFLKSNCDDTIRAFIKFQIVSKHCKTEL